MDQKEATSNQLTEIYRRLTATVPLDLSQEEATALIATGGIFKSIETEWLKHRTAIGNSMHYRRYTERLMLIRRFLIVPVLNGITFNIYWQWFAVDVYGMAEVSVPVAISIMLMIELVTANLKRREWSDTTYCERFWRLLLFPFFNTAMFLMVGWLFHLFL